MWEEAPRATSQRAYSFPASMNSTAFTTTINTKYFSQPPKLSAFNDFYCFIFNFPHSVFTTWWYKTSHMLLPWLLHYLNNNWVKFSLTLITSWFISMSVTVIKFSYWEGKKKISTGCFWPKLVVRIMALCWLRATHEAGDVISAIHAFSSRAPALAKDGFGRGEKGKRARKRICLLEISMREKILF